MNFTTLQKGPIFVKMCGINYYEQTKSSYIKEDNIENKPNVSFIMDPHIWNDINMFLVAQKGEFQPWFLNN
jgi:hypothetical protein